MHHQQPERQPTGSMAEYKVVPLSCWHTGCIHPLAASLSPSLVRHQHGKSMHNNADTAPPSPAHKPILTYIHFLFCFLETVFSFSVVVLLFLSHALIPGCTLTFHWWGKHENFLSFSLLYKGQQQQQQQKVFIVLHKAMAIRNVNIHAHHWNAGPNKYKVLTAHQTYFPLTNNWVDWQLWPDWSDMH